MNSDVKHKAYALRESFGHPPWLEAVGVGELGGEPAIFVYVKGQVPELTVPDVWRGVSVWIRRTGGFRAAGKE